MPRAAFVWALVAGLVAGCAGPSASLDIPEPLRGPVVKETGSVSLVEPVTGPERTKTVVDRGPKVAELRAMALANEVAGPPVPESLSGGTPVTATFEAMPLQAFINEVFGNILGLNFVLAPDLRERADLVTLRVAEPLQPKDLYVLAMRVLHDYGVGAEYSDGLLRFAVSDKAVATQPPILASGLAMPNVPASHRPVFQFVPLRVVSAGAVQNWLKDIFKDSNLGVSDVPDRNAVILVGPPQIVAQALDAVGVLDQPLLQGSQSLRVEPAFWRVKDLSEHMATILKTEGYQVAIGGGGSNPLLGNKGASVFLVPVEPINALFVFASDGSVLKHVEQWVRSLDRPATQQVEKDGLFYYPVRYTMADNLAEVLNALGAGAPPALPPAKDVGAKKDQAAETAAGMAGSGARRLVVDKHRNAIIYQGSGAEWEKLLAVIKEMDRPSQQALIEVTVAEVTLEDQNELGIEWTLQGVGLGDLEGTAGTLGGLSIGSSGFNYFLLNGSGQTRAVLNAFAKSSRVSVLSSPRVLVRSGQTASINVGNDVPVVLSSSTAQDLVNSPNNVVVSEEVQYRKTGVTLEVTPVIHAGGRVDLDVTQEVSSALPNNLGGSSSPVIFSRHLDTSLTLEDGGAVLLGGLISSDRTVGQQQVPGLGDVPVLGQLFRVNSNTGTRNELLVFIVVYVLDDAKEAQDITKAFRKRLNIEHDATGD